MINSIIEGLPCSIAGVLQTVGVVSFLSGGGLRMRVVQTIAGVAMLLYGNFCAWSSLRNLVMGPPAPSYGVANPWPFVVMSLLGLGTAVFGAFLLLRAMHGERRPADQS